MALKPCKECGGEVSQFASKCPHCGVSNPTVSTASALGCLLVLFLAIGGCITYAAVSAPPWHETNNWIDAYVKMERMVAPQLASPSTADFPGVLDGMEGHVKRFEGTKYRINSYVDSQNAFGATVRTKFICVMEQTGERQWQMLSFEAQQ